MFSPEMMQAAQKMMANMKPEDMQRMSQMAANMDPKVMEGMMKNMGGQAPSGVDTKQAMEQMKNMTPEQMRAQMTQAQSQMSAQKQYMKNAAEMLKNEGNASVKAEKYSEALVKYSKALENINSHVGDDIDALKVSLLNNTALCHLKIKDYAAAIKAGDDCLKVDPKSFKALFRRGQAKGEQGSLQEAFVDVRRAAELSPSDKAIASELERLRGQLQERGLQEPPIETHQLRSEWEEPARPKGSKDAAGATPSTSSGSRASSSSSAPPSDPTDGRWKQTAEKIAENPDMLKQASEAMSKMSPDELERMMNAAGAMPGVDKDQLRNSMQQLQQNPDMLTSAMETLQAMPEEERKKMLAGRAPGGMGGAGGMPDPSQLSKVFEDPSMLQHAVNMTKDMSDEDLKRMNIKSKEEADMMRSAAERMAADPDLAKGLSDMMKNISPEQMQEMMKLSGSMRGGGADGMPSMPGGMGGMDPSAMMSDPDMLKATEQMMKNVSPEMLASMAKANGMDISEDNAKRVAKFLPYLMRLMRWFSYLKKLWGMMWSKNGRMVLAGAVVLIAVVQHYRSG